MQTVTELKIGIFDSGTGGLTVANAIHQLYPQASLLYIGDTAHMPWGDKSEHCLKHYAIKITEFLLNQGCNIIVIACNTASAIVVDAIYKYFSAKNKLFKLFNVIDPVLPYLTSNYGGQLADVNIGLIGTKQTILSGAYQRKLSQVIVSDNIKVLATPVLVPLIEKNLVNTPAFQLLLEEYLAQLDLIDESMLILGCTHYGLIRSSIENYYAKIGKNIKIIEGSLLVAQQVKEYLNYNYKINNIGVNIINKFYITDNSQFFFKIARKFFSNISLDFLPLWE